MLLDLFVFHLLLLINLLFITLHVILRIVVRFFLAIVLVLHILDPLLIIVKILLVISLLIDGFHVLLLGILLLSGVILHTIRNALTLQRHQHSWMLTCTLHHITTLNLILESLRPHALMPWRTKWSYFLLAATDIWRCQLTIVISSKIAVRGLARQKSLAPFLLVEIADGSLFTVLVVR